MGLLVHTEIKPFLEPKSVAIIGVSRVTGEGSFNILENLVNAGFSGKLYPVNPYADEILGMRAYPSIRDVPGDIDLAIISTSRSVVPSVVQECTEKGIKAIIIVTQGFADADQEGKELQEEIVRIAAKGGARILGPNTFGAANAFNRFSSAFIATEMERVPIGVISQTGFFFVGLPKFAMVGKAIDVGNACDIDFADVLEYFEDDPEIRLIILHIEGVREGRRFMEVARRVAKKKPILAFKVGKSAEGARAAQSHTGTLVGRDEVYNALFRQCGVIRVSDVDELGDLSKAFLRLPLIKGRGIGVITVTGGAGIMAIDTIVRHNLHAAKLSPETLRKIGALAPSWQRMDNPADIWPAAMIAGHPFEEVFSTTLEAFLTDRNVHGVVLIFAGFSLEASIDPTESILQVADKFKEKPILCWLYGLEPEQMASRLEEMGGIVVYPTLDRAARALSRLNDYLECLTYQE